MSFLRTFLDDYCYEERPRVIDRPPVIGDATVTHCKFCDRGAWLIMDIKHKKNCELAEVLKEIKNIASLD